MDKNYLTNKFARNVKLDSDNKITKFIIDKTFIDNLEILAPSITTSIFQDKNLNIYQKLFLKN